MNPAQPSPILSFLPLIAIFGIFYFLVIRPQQKQAREHQKMLDALKKGDRVLTTGGLYGVIIGLRGPELDLKVADNVKVVIARSAVSMLANLGAELACAPQPQVTQSV